MRRRRSFRFPLHRERPDWWPENQPWPPPRPHWQSARGHFFRRIGCLLFGFIALGTLLFTLVLVLFVHSLGFAETVQASAHWLFPAVIILLVFGLALVGTVIRAVRQLSMPFGDLLDAAGRVAEGDYSTRVPERGPREVRSLAQAFNSMAGRLQAHDRQRRDLLADVTHELRTPLTVIQGNLEGMLDGVYPADQAQLKLLVDETNLLSRLVDDLRVLALAESGALQLRKEPVDPAMLIRETLSAFQARALATGVTLEFQGPEGLSLELDPERIRQVLSNLVANALCYTPQDGRVSVRCELPAAPGESACAISVTDSGPGVPAEDLEHIFERFHKSADSGGMGLGLSIARSLVQAHGGYIEAHSRPGEGMTVRFVLPVEDWKS